MCVIMGTKSREGKVNGLPLIYTSDPDISVFLSDHVKLSTFQLHTMKGPKHEIF